MYQIDYIEFDNDIVIHFIVYTKIEPLSRTCGIYVILENQVVLISTCLKLLNFYLLCKQQTNFQTRNQN